MHYLPKSCLIATLAALWGAGAVRAASINLNLAPPGASISGPPRSTVGWGFTLVNPDTDWISVTSSALTFETNPSLGLYTDLIGLQGGPLPSFAVAPSTSWSEVFDGVSRGIGSYAISSSAAPFAQNSGLILVNFDIFDGDPLNGGNQIDSSAISAAFTVNIASSSEVPEPSTFALMAAALGVAFALRRGYAVAAAVNR